jgi:DNA-directed RNA polymerase subunit RPC12/RpoP
MAPYAVCTRGCGYLFDFEEGNPGPKKLHPTKCPTCGGAIASACLRCDTALEAVPTALLPQCPYCHTNLLAMFKRIDRDFSLLLSLPRTRPRFFYREAG